MSLHAGDAVARMLQCCSYMKMSLLGCTGNGCHWQQYWLVSKEKSEKEESFLPLVQRIYNLPFKNWVIHWSSCHKRQKLLLSLFAVQGSVPQEWHSSRVWNGEPIVLIWPEPLNCFGLSGLSPSPLLSTSNECAAGFQLMDRVQSQYWLIGMTPKAAFTQCWIIQQPFRTWSSCVGKKTIQEVNDYCSVLVVKYITMYWCSLCGQN